MAVTDPGPAVSHRRSDRVEHPSSATATSAELARYRLHALGKRCEPLTCGRLWSLVYCHLHTERVQQLAVMRAHTLSYQALEDSPTTPTTPAASSGC